MEAGRSEIEEEPVEAASPGQHEASSGADLEAHEECPLCLGRGEVSEGSSLGFFLPHWQSYWDGRASRRRRQRANPSCLPCRAVTVSLVYITLATILGFLGFSFFPRNPDFDIEGIHFTKLQLRWEKDETVSGVHAEAPSNFQLFAEELGSTGQEGVHQEKQDQMRIVEEGRTSAELLGFSNGSDELGSIAKPQQARSVEALLEGSMESWDDFVPDDGATIFGRRLVLDIDLLVRVLVKNPNNVGVHYQASSLDIIYKDKKLGSALLPPGQQAAASTTVLTVPAQLNGLSTIGMSLALLRDWRNKSVEMDIAARFTGTVDLIKLIPHEFIADMYCDVLTNPRTLDIMKRTCKWRYGGKW